MSDVAGLIEQVLVKGDLAKLTADERLRYYNEVCKSVGLNPLTQPLAYITLNNKLTLYALRGATDQLRAVHKVSVTEMTSQDRGDVHVVTVKVVNGEGRTDMATGAVALGNIKGEALANALMKAETKAKRRATLSICGLGLLDETEVETIPGAKPAELNIDEGKTPPKRVQLPEKPQTPPGVEAGVDPATGEVGPFTLAPPQAGWIEWAQNLIAQASTSTNADTVAVWLGKNTECLGLMALEAPKAHTRLKMALAKIALRLELPPQEETAAEASESPVEASQPNPGTKPVEASQPSSGTKATPLATPLSKATADGLLRNLQTVHTPEALKGWLERAEPALPVLQDADYQRVHDAYVEKDRAIVVPT